MMVRRWGWVEGPLVYGLVLKMFEFLTNDKGGSTEAFLSVFPDVRQKRKEDWSGRV